MTLLDLSCALKGLLRWTGAHAGPSASRCIGARNWLCLSYIITSQRTAKLNQKIYKGSLSESVRDGEREMTANKIRSCQKLFSQKAKKCPIHYSAPSFMFNGDLRRIRERRKSKVGCCVLVIKTLKISPFMFHRIKKVIHGRNNMR